MWKFVYRFTFSHSSCSFIILKASLAIFETVFLLNPALSRLLTSLQQATELPSTEEELGFLSDLLQSKELHALVNVHNKILCNGASDKFFPILSTSMHVMLDVLDVLASKTHTSEDCKELFFLLQRPHVQVILREVLLHLLLLCVIYLVSINRQAINMNEVALILWNFVIDALNSSECLSHAIKR